MNVIAFPADRVRPEKPLSCLDCQHLGLFPRGMRCSMFDEWINYDNVANECNEYDPL